jgi:hypothetical protein
LKHLNAHATEALSSSGDGQHGMSAWSAIDNLVELIETPRPADAGIMATEMAIKAAKTVRANAMHGLSGDMG